MSKQHGNPKTNTWQHHAAPSVIKNGEAGTTKRVSPAKSPDKGQATPNGVGKWPYC
jgi:hypothetical protein